MFEIRSFCIYLIKSAHILCNCIHVSIQVLYTSGKEGVDESMVRRKVKWEGKGG